MNTEIVLHEFFPGASQLVLGCMGFGGGGNDPSPSEQDYRTAELAIESALESKINYFDHADIYASGKAERVFGQWLNAHPEWRQKIILQSKGGIRFADEDGNPKQYELSRNWIISCVDGTLQRLHTDYLDVWLLHRPDPLMEPEEIAEAFSTLKAAGKVRYFGVSNMHLHHLRLLQASLPDPLIVNQLPISLARVDWLEEGVMVGDPRGKEIHFAPGTMEYCRMNRVQVQSWGSLAQGIFSGRDVSRQSEAIRSTAALVAQLARKNDTSKEAIVLGWLLRHPARIQPVIGTTNPDRITACASAQHFRLDRKDWYALYVSARGSELP